MLFRSRTLACRPAFFFGHILAKRSWGRYAEIRNENSARGKGCLLYTSSGNVRQKLRQAQRAAERDPAFSVNVEALTAAQQMCIRDSHYCDSVGFQEIPGFLPSNPLKNAEMTVEDDYGMIDGIINNGPKATVAELEAQARSGQPISLMDLADAVHREERDKKKSVMEQLRQSPKQERKKTAPKKSAEREL